MESLTEKRFYGALGIVPEVPPEIFTRVDRAVRRPNVLLRTAIAACLALAVIIPALTLTVPSAKQYAYADDNDFFDDLFYAFEYLNGNLDNDLFIDNQITRLSFGTGTKK